MVDPAAVVDDAAIIGGQDPGQAVKQGRLPRAGWTNDGQDLAALDLEVDAAERVDATEARDEPVGTQDGSVMRALP